MVNLISIEEIDRVDVVSVVDNFIDILMAGAEGVKRLPLRDIEWGRDEYPVAEHGYSVLLRTNRGRHTHTVLFDAGLSATGLVHNVELLGIQLNTIEAIVLSHGHGDHTGGLLGLTKKVGRRRLPLILHPHAFRKRKVVFPDGTAISLPPPDRQVLRDAGLEVSEEVRSSLLLDNSVLVTGEVARTTEFEKGNPIHYAEIDEKLEKDPLILDDQAVVMLLRGKGLVIVTGCGHAGLINTIRYAQEITGVRKIHAVMGGFHLSGKIFEPIIPQTIEELKRIQPTMIIPSHCSGWKAVHAIREALPEAFVQNSVGTTYSL